MSYLRTSIYERDSTLSFDLSKNYSNLEVIYSGWLMKRVIYQGKTSWKKRFFVLNSEVLIYSKTSSSKKALGRLCSKDLSITTIGPQIGDKFAFVTYERTMYIQALNIKDKAGWVEAIKQLQHTLVATGRERINSIQKSSQKKEYVDQARKSFLESHKDQLKREIDSEVVKMENQRLQLEKISKQKELETKEEEKKPEKIEQEKDQEKKEIEVVEKDAYAKKATNVSEMNTVNAILEDEIGIKFFKLFLESQFSDAQLDFWRDVRDYIKMVETEEERKFPKENIKRLLNSLIEIGDNYVHEGMDKTVNIGKGLRDPLIKLHEMSLEFINSKDILNWTHEYTAQIFEDIIKHYQIAQYDVFKMLRGSYVRFRKSQFFKQLQSELTVANKNMTDISSRGNCLRIDCCCEMYTEVENSSMSNCLICNHFYEEHKNLSVEDSFKAMPTYGVKKEVTAEQRRKLQMLLGKSAKLPFSIEKNTSRIEFLIDNLTGVVYHPSDPLILKSHRSKLKKYKNCFEGKDFVVKMQNRLKVSKNEAIGIAAEMMEHKIIVSISKSQNEFIDGKFYYQLTKQALEDMEKRSQHMEYNSTEEEAELEPSKASVSTTPESESKKVDLLDLLFTSKAMSSEESKETESESKVKSKEKKSKKKSKKKEETKKKRDVSKEKKGVKEIPLEEESVNLFDILRTPQKEIEKKSDSEDEGYQNEEQEEEKQKKKHRKKKRRHRKRRSHREMNENEKCEAENSENLNDPTLHRHFSAPNSPTTKDSKEETVANKELLKKAGTAMKGKQTKSDKNALNIS